MRMHPRDLVSFLRQGRLSSYLTLTSSAALAQAILFVISPIVTRLYAPEDFGGFGVILGMGALMASVGSGRLEHAVPVAARSVQAMQVAMLGMLFAFSASLLCAVAVFTIWRMGFVVDSDWQEFPLLAIPIIMFSLAFFQLINALLLRQKAYRSVGRNKICQGGVTGGLQLLLGVAGLGAAGLIWAQAFGYLAGGWNGARRLLVHAAVVVRVHGLQVRETFGRFRRFPLVLAPSALFNQAAQQLPVLALGYVYGLYEAGLYALVTRICGAPLGLLGQAVAQVYASEFRVYVSDGGRVLARNYLAMLLRLSVLGIVIVAAMVLILSLWGTWLFGARWANIGTVSMLLAPMLITDFATTPLSMTLGYLSRERAQLIWDIARLISIVLVFVLAQSLELRFGQLLVMLAGVWALSLMVHAWLTYRACGTKLQIAS